MPDGTTERTSPPTRADDDTVLALFDRLPELIVLIEGGRMSTTRSRAS